MSCELCLEDGGIILYQTSLLRIVLATDVPGYTGICRVIWNEHVQEMSDLDAVDQGYLLEWVMKVEHAVREVLQPDKINLASLGNVVPHLHWHVIPRFKDDTHFPAPIWGAPRRVAPARPFAEDLASRLRAALIAQH